MGRARSAGPSRRSVDLTGIISLAEKEDLIILVARITENMTRQIGEVFDCSTPTPSDPGCSKANTWIDISIPLEKLKLKDDCENPATDKEQTVLPAETPRSGTGSTFCSTQNISNIAHKTPPCQLSELKKELLVIFRKWQSIVLQRVRDIRVTETMPQDHFDDQSFVRGRGRGIRGGRGAARGFQGRSSIAARSTGPLRPQPFDETDPQLAQRFRPSPTPLWQLPLVNRKRLIHVTLLLLLSLEEYTAYSRNLMFHLTSSLHLPLAEYQEAETQLARGLGQTAVDFDPVAALRLSEELKAARKGRPGPGMGQPSRPTNMLSCGLVAAGVGALLAAGGSGKIAAAGLLGPMSEIGIPVGGLFGIYMAKSSIKPMDAYTKDIQDFAFIPVRGKVMTALRDSSEVYHEDRRLRIVIAISGWLLEDDNIKDPWECFGSQGEVHAFRWEMNTLKNLGTALDTVVQSSAWNVAKKEIASKKIFAIIECGRWPAELLKISKIIDIPWSIGMVRADKAGLVLADTIQRKIHGSRPVTLIGYSLAARVIYTCLMALAERRQFGLIDSVVMIGAPAPSETRVWLTLRSVVAGRLVNVYSENDYMLGFMMRTSNTQFGVSGLQPITGTLGVENYDASAMVSGHLRYQFLVGTVLKDLAWEDLDYSQLARGRKTLAAMDAKYGKAKTVEGNAPGSGKTDAQGGGKKPWGNGGDGVDYRGRGGGGCPRRGRRNNYRNEQSRPGKSTIQA